MQLTDREAGVMQVLWEAGPSVVAEVRARLDDPLAYTTVLTVLRTLEAKGYVSHTDHGRGYRYFALVKQASAQRSALNHLAKKMFQGSVEALFLHMVSGETLSKDQYSRIKRKLDSKFKGKE